MKKLGRSAALSAAVAALAVAPAAHAGAGVRDRAVLSTPDECAFTAQVNSLNQFMFSGSNTPLKIGGTLRSCSTNAETVKVDSQLVQYAAENSPQAAATPPAGCDVPEWQTAAIPLKPLEFKGYSMQTGSPTCPGYYYFRVRVLDAATDAALDGDGWQFTLHVAAK
jgi:hypothetical protein